MLASQRKKTAGDYLRACALTDACTHTLSQRGGEKQDRTEGGREEGGRRGEREREREREQWNK